MGKSSSSEDGQLQAAQAALARQMAATGQPETQEGAAPFTLALPSPNGDSLALARAGKPTMNFNQGMRRLAIFAGVLGAVAGGAYAYKDLHNVPSERAQHKVFEHLAALDVVKQDQAILLSSKAAGLADCWPLSTSVSGVRGVPPCATVEPITKLPKGLTLIEPTPIPEAQSVPPRVDYDALANKYGGVPGQPSAPVAASAAMDHDAANIKTIFWKNDLSVDFFVMEDGGTVSSEPSPSIWSYLLAGVFPVLGFFILWCTIRGIGWVGAGFFETP